MKFYKELHKDLYSNFKNYLDNNKSFKQKYIEYVTAFTYLSTKPIKYLMLHLMDIQGLDPNKSKVLSENLSKIFGDIEYPAYESDFDLEPFISKIKRDGKIKKFVKVLNSDKPFSTAVALLEKEINLALLEAAVDSAGILDLKEESEKYLKTKQNYSDFLKLAHKKNKEIQEKRDAIRSKCKFKREK